MGDKRVRLPVLRQELDLQPAPPALDGAPSWTLHDPANNRFFQIGWPAFEMLSRWSLGAPEAIAEAVTGETTLEVTTDEVMALAQFLIQHHLTQTGDPESTRRLNISSRMRRLSGPRWLLKHYLFVRIPLVRPMPFLRRAYPWIRGVYSSRFWWLVLAVTLVGIYLASRQWDTFIHTFSAYTNWQGLLGLGVALSFAKVLHELGHAFTAYRYGCRVPAMGVALLVMWPVLYTDTNEAWKLRSRRERLHIGAAGMLAELTLAAFATLLWSFLPDGPVRSGVFMLATSTWVMTLAINASPFTRFDGYFLLSDWLNMPNLHERSFALGRWWLRERLFGFGDAPPEHLSPARQRGILLLAFATWLYRFVLFLSIALLVFHLFFRALGLLLMCVEIGWFIVLPISRELKVWWQRRRDVGWNHATVRTLAVTVAGVLILVVPWQSTIRAAAVLGDAQAQRIYTPQQGQLDRLSVREGQMVQAGDVLAELHSPLLRYRLQRALEQQKMLELQVRQQPFDKDLRAMGPALGKQLATAREVVKGLRAQIAHLTLRAPFSGQVVDINPSVHQGAWLGRSTPLLQLVAPGKVKGKAYVGESDVSNVHVGQKARFVAGLAEAAALNCVVDAVDRVNLSSLDEPYVSSVYGGPVPSVKSGGGRLVPLDPLFRVRFSACDKQPVLAEERPGALMIDADRSSLWNRGVRWIGALARREAGF